MNLTPSSKKGEELYFTFTAGPGSVVGTSPCTWEVGSEYELLSAITNSSVSGNSQTFSASWIVIRVE